MAGVMRARRTSVAATHAGRRATPPASCSRDECARLRAIDGPRGTPPPPATRDDERRERERRRAPARRRRVAGGASHQRATARPAITAARPTSTPTPTVHASHDAPVARAAPAVEQGARSAQQQRDDRRQRRRAPRRAATRTGTRESHLGRRSVTLEQRRAVRRRQSAKRSAPSGPSPAPATAGRQRTGPNDVASRDLDALATWPANAERTVSAARRRRAGRRLRSAARRPAADRRCRAR